jgi:trans-2,3-dihydro-3-hydroxyanthranilate isomerase
MLDDERHGHAVFDLPRLPSPTNDPADRTAVAMALDLSPAELGFENHVPTGFEAGVPYAFVPVRDLAIIARARPQQGHFARAFGENQSVYVYTRETVGNEHHFHGRMFAPALGFYEDPATGSAIAAFAGVIRRFDTPPDGSHRYVIEQGFEMRRPSLIRLELDIENGTLAGARIGGDAVVIAAGTLDA